jgi:hypothetical protein
LSGLHPNDVINSVHGKLVRTPVELTAGLSGKGQGQKIRLGYLVRGQWQTETFAYCHTPHGKVNTQRPHALESFADL